MFFGCEISYNWERASKAPTAPAEIGLIEISPLKFMYLGGFNILPYMCVLKRKFLELGQNNNKQGVQR